MSLRILATPLNIYESVLKIFPSVQTEIILEPQGSVKMKLTLSPNIPTLMIDHALDAEVFSKSLLSYKAQLFLHQPPLPVLDMRRFSLAPPLQDWQKFRRVMYEKQGNSCTRPIMNYLNGNDDQEALLSTLGLAPGQLREPLKECDFSYFREIPRRLASASAQDRKAFYTRMQIKYPTVYAQLLAEEGTQEQQRLPQEPDFMQPTIQKLQERVIGQDMAIERMAGLLAQQRNSPKNAVYLFVGPTGVGKTELAKAVSDIKQGRFVSFPMNQFQSQEDVSRFFGSSIGYVGSTDKPHFAKEIERYVSSSTTDGHCTKSIVRNVVILFDELEKAHALLKQSFLTLFDEGKCSVQYVSDRTNQSIVYYFEKCIFINTSNLYQGEILHAYRHSDSAEQIAKMFQTLNHTQPSVSSYSPELLGRMTHIIPFGPIPHGVCYQKLLDTKLKKFFPDLQRELSCREIGIENKELFLSILESKLYGEGIDIRRVETYFTDVKSAIYQQEQKLGGFRNKKLLFSPSATGLCIKVFQFVESMADYRDLNISIPLP